MKTNWLWLASTLLASFGLFAGCGGTSDGGAGSVAGKSSGGAAGMAGASSDGSVTANGGADAGASGLGECEKADCGPQLGLPNWTCADGSLGGPTGRCLRRPGGTCGWEINDCPMAGGGGAAHQGGQANAAGETGAGGAPVDDCGGCSPETICVYQVGGPGPSHFVCATLNPCRAASACACIVGQGTCQPNLMGDPPNYCSCDNGLD